MEEKVKFTKKFIELTDQHGPHVCEVKVYADPPEFICLTVKNRVYIHPSQEKFERVIETEVSISLTDKSAKQVSLALEEAIRAICPESISTKQVPEDTCIYDGPASPNAVNTVTSAIACYEGQKIKVYIVPVQE